MDIASNITGLSSFSYNGQGGSDAATFSNDASSVPWTYTHAATSFTAAKSGYSR